MEPIGKLMLNRYGLVPGLSVLLGLSCIAFTLVGEVPFLCRGSRDY